MLDATPPGDQMLYKCPVAEQVIYCDDILKRLAEDEVLIEDLKTQDQVNKNIRDQYNDLLTKYIMLLEMYRKLEDQKEHPRPVI